MATQSTQSRNCGKAANSKPEKPYKDFPLFPHATGRWAKKIRGKLYYFGYWRGRPGTGWKEALELYQKQRDDLFAGRTPRENGGALTLRDLCNRFLTHKQRILDSDEITQRTFDEYKTTTDRLISVFGKQRLVDDLVADDFQALRADMAKQWGPVRLSNEIQRVRSVFKYGYDERLVDKPVFFGQGFKKPSAKVIRKARASNGPRMFEAHQIRKALEHATTNMRAMILLAVNGGFGNTDVAELPKEVVDLEKKWLDFPRPKTGIARRVPLWPETVNAIRSALQERREPNNPADAGLLFIGPRGEGYVGKRFGYRVYQEAKRVFDKARISGRTFYDLRRTFQTVGEGSNDLVAVQAIMGHSPASGDMSAIYRQRVDDDRLEAVVRYVRDWLFGDAKKMSRMLHRDSSAFDGRPI